MSQFVLRLEQQDLVTVNEALAAQPLGKVINTFMRIQQQVQEQTSGQTPRSESKSNGAQKELED